MSARLHVRSVLKGIDNFSKLFFLSQFKSRTTLQTLPSWRKLSMVNLWTLTGFFVHFSFHLTYVSHHDAPTDRPKLVTVFIDMYVSILNWTRGGWWRGTGRRTFEAFGRPGIFFKLYLELFRNYKDFFTISPPFFKFSRSFFEEQKALLVPIFLSVCVFVCVCVCVCPQIACP